MSGKFPGHAREIIGLFQEVSGKRPRRVREVSMTVLDISMSIPGNVQEQCGNLTSCVYLMFLLFFLVLSNANMSERERKNGKGRTYKSNPYGKSQNSVRTSYGSNCCLFPARNLEKERNNMLRHHCSLHCVLYMFPYVLQVIICTKNKAQNRLEPNWIYTEEAVRLLKGSMGPNMVTSSRSN